MSDKIDELKARCLQVAKDLYVDTPSGEDCEEEFVSVAASRIEEIVTGYMVDGIIQGIHHCMMLVTDRTLSSVTNVFTRDHIARQAAYRTLITEFGNLAASLQKKLRGPETDSPNAA